MDATIRRIAQHAVLFCALRQEALNDAITEALGDYSYDVDTVEQKFRFISDRGEATAKVESIASITAEPASVLWVWSPLLKNSGGTNDASLHIRSVGQQQGISSLTTEEVPYTVDKQHDQGELITMLAHDLGMLAVELCGPQTFYYPLSSGGPSRLVTLLSNVSVPVPMFSVDDFLIKLARLLASGMVDDFDWSLSGLVRLRGWTSDSEQGPDGARRYTITDENGRSRTLSVTFDDLNRVTQLDVTTGGN